MAPSLSANQTTYITQRTNERGAANQPPAHYLSCMAFGSGGNDSFLNIIVQDDGETEGGHGYSRRAGKDVLEQPNITAEFRDLVEKTIDGALRHVG